MKAPSIKSVRCAIYTRVSTEHGLDQEFNSLDAQYEAASTYIKSQAHADRTDGAPDQSDGPSLTIPWQKPPSKRARRILLPHGKARGNARPEQFERRARLVNAVAKGRRWLNDVISGRVTNITELCTREECSVRQVNMTISLAFLATNLVKAAVQGRLPPGIGVERLRDLPTEWSRQFEVLGLSPE
jgi:site-specific DNA recombinase